MKVYYPERIIEGKGRFGVLRDKSETQLRAVLEVGSIVICGIRALIKDTDTTLQASSDSSGYRKCF